MAASMTTSLVVSDQAAAVLAACTPSCSVEFLSRRPGAVSSVARSREGRLSSRHVSASQGLRLDRQSLELVRRRRNRCSTTERLQYSQTGPRAEASAVAPVLETTALPQSFISQKQKSTQKFVIAGDSGEDGRYGQAVGAFEYEAVQITSRLQILEPPSILAAPARISPVTTGRSPAVVETGAQTGLVATSRPGHTSLEIKTRQSKQASRQLAGDQISVLRDPALNKGTAFTSEERQRMGIRGLLPPRVEALDVQAKRAMALLQSFSEPINRYLMLSSLNQTNETLFYHVLINYLEELLPIVYTPTVGEACLKFGDIYRAAQGMFFCHEDKVSAYSRAGDHAAQRAQTSMITSFRNLHVQFKVYRESYALFAWQGHVRAMLDSWPQPEVDVIVVTDGGRILGLGDLGANGMPISVGKLSLYVAGGGFHPARTLPVMLDMGTDNEGLLSDPLYLGSRHKRIEGQAHMALVDEFVAAVKDKWPNALIQFEDFKTEHAIEILERHRKDAFCFNDDIQGTGAVIAAGLINACKAQQIPLAEAKVLFYGAGSAAVGVAQTIVSLLEEAGLRTEESKDRIYMVDRKGLITLDRPGELEPHKLIFARKESWDLNAKSALEDIVAAVKPTALLGLSGTPGVFTKEVVEELRKFHSKPAIFPLSNPTSKSEITAEDAVRWSDGNLIFAAGSPFPPVQYAGRTFYPGQGNNMFIFPGVGFGSVLCRAKMVTDGMFIAAAQALASCLSEEQLQQGQVFPHVSSVRDISMVVASAVIDRAFTEGVAGIPRPASIPQYVQQNMYSPDYAR
eukprot:SM000026S08929  [mRNA]  locus=s26:564450:569220:- [translate_table: standard]